MSELSPAADAVLNAYMNNCGWLDGPFWKDYQCAAAVLRAAVDEVISSVPPPCADYDEYAQGFLDAHVKYRGQLLEIADELEAN